MALDAKRLWIDWHNRHGLETAQVVGDDLAAHFAKLKDVCPRIALVFACVGVVDSGACITSIDAEAMQRAIVVVEWFKNEARRCYERLAETKEDGRRRKLVEWIGARGGSVSARDLTHGLRQYRGQTEAARAALDELVGVGHGHWEPSRPSPRGGRPSRQFRLKAVTSVTDTQTHTDDSAGEGNGDSGDGPGSADGDGREIFTL